MLRKPRLWLALLLVCVLIVSAAPPIPTTAQGSAPTVLTIGLPEFFRDSFNERVIKGFEASHPGVKLNLVTIEPSTPFAANGVDQHLDGVKKLVSSADVLFVDLNTLNSSVATQAGYFLDLMPLAEADKALNKDDFYPAFWKNFQWDKGLWALPVSGTGHALVYDPAAFDKAGLAYPTSKWTLDDLATAARALAQKNSEGNVVTPALAVFPEATVMLLLSLTGETLFDTSAIPNGPRLAKPALEAALEGWAKLVEEGLTSGDFNNAAMSLVPVEFMLNTVNQKTKRAGVLLPGGKGGLDVRGFAVSAGTPYPDQAYELARYLTMQPDVANWFIGSPARKSLVGKQGGGMMRRPDNSPEMDKLNEEILNNALTLSDLRYADYLFVAQEKMKSQKLDAKSALQTVEADALKAQQAAADRKKDLKITLSTPAPRAAAPVGKAALNFGMTSFVRPVPNRDKWDTVLNEFAQSDPQVGKVDLTLINEPINQAADKYDCFYMPYNAVPSVDLTKLINLDPFLSADKTFDKADVVSGLIAQLQRDNKMWALPIMIEPSVLQYHQDKFAKASIPEPINGWTTDSFVAALKALKPDPKDPAPFVTGGIGGIGGTHLLTLIAAYGGLPLDYRTTPPTINFTDPATVDAIRQVLDLAKQGYIKYSKTANVPFKAMMAIAMGRESDDAIRTAVLNGFTFGPEGPNPSSKNPYRLTTYPKGSRFNALSYNIGTAYISAKSQNPEACYRLINHLARHPELFSSMPARRSLINDKAAAAAQGEDLTALYKQIDALLNDPNTVTFPSGFAGGGAARLVLEYWLYNAFDEYVLKDGDLEALLKDAEARAKAFQECAAGIKEMPNLEINPNSPNPFQQCAIKIDPSMK